SVGRADPVAQSNLPSPRQSHLCGAGGRRQQFLPGPPARSRLAPRRSALLFASGGSLRVVERGNAQVWVSGADIRRGGTPPSSSSLEGPSTTRRALTPSA